MKLNKWGGLASFLLAISFLVAPMIYLLGNLRNALGIFAYGLADFLYGPIIAAGLVTLTYTMREHLGKNAPRRMDLALLAAILSAVGLAAVAFIRAANRQYHLAHPELGLENSITVLAVWSTLVSGMNSMGFHFLGWTFLLLGSAGWTTRLLPRTLSGFYLLAGSFSLFVYLFPVFEGASILLSVIIGIWQAFLLWQPPQQTAPQA